MEIKKNGVTFHNVIVVNANEGIPSNYACIFSNVVNELDGKSYDVWGLADGWENTETFFAIRTYNDDKIVAMANTLGKYETQTVTVENQKYILCGTCLVYEDDLCAKVREAFNTLGKIFGEELDEDDLENCVSEVRDEVLERFESLVGGRIIYGSNEY